MFIRLITGLRVLQIVSHLLFEFPDLLQLVLDVDLRLSAAAAAAAGANRLQALLQAFHLQRRNKNEQT